MPDNKDIQSAKRTIDKEIEALRVMENDFDESLSQALDILEKTTGKIIVTGMGKSGHIGKKIAATLASTGAPSFFVHPAEASHGDLGMLDKGDVIIAISNGGESKELSDILIFSKRFGFPIIAITKDPDSTLGKAGNIVLKLPNNGEACPLGLAPTSSTTATLVLGDVLAVALLERKGFSKTDYKQRHPGGKLGAILQKVSDLMHKGDELPLISETANMQQALLVMTSKMLGCVGIVDKENNLLGIITDGDLRRIINSNMLTQSPVDVMTKNPKVITSDALVAEAVALMNEKKITQLFAMKDNKPVGVIHLHDCLKAGVA
ncbi:MAG: KpsF/GutQ family sugar-phosphate isomerase [Alphaproteobacteria bacterium]|nr:KpsF/GutQ family sugar-phosphate isomerase [Alphaproteobacteria bacterium]